MDPALDGHLHLGAGPVHGRQMDAAADGGAAQALHRLEMDFALVPFHLEGGGEIDPDAVGDRAERRQLPVVAVGAERVQGIEAGEMSKGCRQVVHQGGDPVEAGGDHLPLVTVDVDGNAHVSPPRVLLLESKLLWGKFVSMTFREAA